MGVTFYGTVDVGYAYIHNGAFPSGSHYYGASYGVYSSPFNHGDVSTLTNNALQLSNIGLKIEEQLGGGFLAIGKLETQFNPISGELGDACASLLRNSGRSLFDQDKNGDGSRCGQAFNNVAYGGVSNPLYGTLTAGRQTSLVSDGMGVYDPIPGSPAFSLLGYSASAGAGTGSSESSAWDNSVKYILSYGPFHHRQRSLGRDGEVHLQRAGLLLGTRAQHEGCPLRRLEGCAMRAAFCEGHPLCRLSVRRPVEPGQSAVLLQRKHDGRRLQVCDDRPSGFRKRQNP
jgi:Gram-negative porin